MLTEPSDAYTLLSDEALEIDLVTRNIKIPTTKTFIGVENDSDVNVIPFKLSSTYNGIDLTDFTFFVNYINANAERDAYEVTDAAEKDGEITFTWTVSHKASSYRGDLSFIVCAKKFDTDGVTVVKSINTTVATLKVLKGIESSAHIAQQYADLMEQWKQSIIDSVGGDIDKAVSNYITNNGIYATVEDCSVTKAKLSTEMQEKVEEVDVLKTELSEISTTSKSTNVFDKDSITLDKYWDVFENNSTIWRNGTDLKDSTDYYVTDLIPVKDGDVVRSNISWFNFVYYNSSKELSRCADGGNQAEKAASEFTISGDLVAYIQLTYLKDNSSYDMLMITINSELPSSYEGYVAETKTIKDSALKIPLSKYVSKTDIVLEDKWVRKDVYINTTDTQEQILVKMLNAVSEGNCDVYFEPGDYTFTTVFDLMKSDYGYTTAYELPIGGNCRYFFQGSKLTATKTTTDTNVAGNESLIGSRRGCGSYELYDGTLICNDMVYCVHDEAQGCENPYTRKYKNMVMKYNTVSSTETLRKCIGGGTGLHGTVIIEDCVFINDNNQDVSYHGHDKEDTTEFRLTISNSYFSKKIQLADLSTNETGIALLSGNSFGEANDTTSKWTVYDVNNTTR